MGGFLSIVYYLVWNESNTPEKDDDNEDDKDNKDPKNQKKEKDGYLLLNNNEDIVI